MATTTIDTPTKIRSVTPAVRRPAWRVAIGAENAYAPRYVASLAALGALVAVSGIIGPRPEILALVVATLAGQAAFVFRPMCRRIALETQRQSGAAARHRAEAERHAFGLRLREAIDLADTESSLIDVVHHAHEASSAVGHAEVLLTDPHNPQALTSVSPEPRHRCSVRSVDACPALRRARTIRIDDPSELGACSHFRRDCGDTDGLATTCVPMTSLGVSVGVLRNVTEAGMEASEGTPGDIEAIARTAGPHVGTLRALAQTRADAERDPLTGLFNRRGLEESVAPLTASRTPYVAIAVDLDHFKEINDTYGHDGGDQVLIETAEAMLSVLRPGDILARHGGEEFVLIAPLSGEGRENDQELAVGVAIAERIRSVLAARKARDTGPACTASLGVAGPFVGDLDGALRHADAALYRAKELGRNRVEVEGALLEELPAPLLETIAEMRDV